MKNWQKNIEKLCLSEKNKIIELNLSDKSIEYSNKIKLHRTINTITGNEEIVRAFLINRLVNELDYKLELIEIEKEYNIGRPKVNKARIDIVLNDDKGNPFFFIEVKAPEKFENDQEYIEGQLYQLAKLQKKVKYLVYYTLDFKNNEISDRAIIIDFEKYPEYSDWEKAGFIQAGDQLTPGYNKPKIQPLIKGHKTYDLTTELNIEDIEGLGKRLHNVLWGGGGTNDSEIFYSLVNLILAKIQDESERNQGEEYQFQVLGYDDNIESPQKVFKKVNELYKRALNEKLHIHDERKLDKMYIVNEEKFPLNKLVHTVQSLQKYSFTKGKSKIGNKDILGDFFESITRDGFKQTKGQFFTPIPIVKFILYALKIDELAITRLNKDKELPFIIDPSAGSGTYLIEAMKAITKEIKYKQFDKIESNDTVQSRFEELFKPDRNENRWARKYIYGVDLNFDLGIASKVNMILHGDGTTNIFIKDGLLPFRFYKKETAPNYLQKAFSEPLYNDKEINGEFDIIISNPPFSVNLDTQTKRQLPHSFIFSNKKNSENLFLERWYQLLRENGRLGVVLPESVFDTSENKYIRLFLFKYFNIKAVISLPQVTFEPYTSTKTSLLFAQKKTKQEINKWNIIWEKYGKEWSKLQIRMKNYIDYFVNEKELNKKWAKDVIKDIDNNNESDIKNNILRFLKDYKTAEDLKLSIKDILKKYYNEINELSKYDKDTTELFGFYNTWWVFKETAKELNYKIFMAEADNVGYKRTKRGELEMPNDLYDIEFAPNSLNKDEIISKYQEKIKDNEKTKLDLKLDLIKIENIIKDKSNKTLEKKLIKLKSDYKKLNEIIKIISEEKQEVENIINQYYKNGNLKINYIDRTDKNLTAHFKNGLLKKHQSTDILLRQNETVKILDYMRREAIWN